MRIIGDKVLYRPVVTTSSFLKHFVFAESVVHKVIPINESGLEKVYIRLVSE